MKIPRCRFCRGIPELIGGGSSGWKANYRAEAKGYRVTYKFVDPGWIY